MTRSAFYFLQIKKPRTSSYIRLVLLPSGLTVYKVDALSQNVTIGSNSTTLHFAIPHPVLSMDGLYVILIDKRSSCWTGLFLWRYTHTWNSILKCMEILR